jgi:6-phosphogluconate dehydrogenase
MSVTPQVEQFGLIGLGVMGENLALNIEDHGYRVALWTHTEAKVQRFVESSGASRRWVGTRTLEELTAALTPPRRILLMVKAGKPVDEMLERLAPCLFPGDVVIDGGNSFFRHTQRREAAVRAQGVKFGGMGVSGDEGARHGPSLMPGGAHSVYDLLRPVLESIAEAYDLLRRGLGLPADEVVGILAEWNRGPLESYLLDVTAQVLAARDPETGNPLVEMILDQAGQKGTGKWTALSALDLGVPISTIAAAIDAPSLSSMKGERVSASTRVASGTTGRVDVEPREMTAAIHAALRALMVCAYTQGMALLRVASIANNWKVDLREIARIWEGGCIIRGVRDTLMHAFERVPDLPNLLLDAELVGTASASAFPELRPNYAAGSDGPAEVQALMRDRANHAWCAIGPTARPVSPGS